MELKLAKLPDRTPVKITISVRPKLNTALQAYAELYRKAYGDSETVAELIPYMLRSFLDGDRNFSRTFRTRAVGDGSAAATLSPQTTRAREVVKGKAEASS